MLQILERRIVILWDEHSSIKKPLINNLYKNNHDQSLIQDPFKRLRWSYIFILV